MTEHPRACLLGLLAPDERRRRGGDPRIGLRPIAGMEADRFTAKGGRG